MQVPSGYILSGMSPVLRFLAIIFSLAATTPRAHALDLPVGLAPGGTGRVVEVIDGDTVVLADGHSSGWSASRPPSCRSGARAFRPGLWLPRPERSLPGSCWIA